MVVFDRKNGEMLIWERKWSFLIKNWHFQKLPNFWIQIFIFFAKRFEKIHTKNSQNWLFFAKMTNFIEFGPRICNINDLILQNAFYSRIFVIISRLFAYNWIKCRNLRFLQEIVKTVSHKILMWQKCDNLRYLNGTFF